MISEEQRNRIAEIVDKYMSKIIYLTGGPDAIDKEKLSWAISKGYISPEATPLDIFRISFAIGKIPVSELEKVTTSKLKKLVSPLNVAEKEAVRYAAKKGGQYLTTLGDYVKNNALASVDEQNKRDAMEQVIKKETAAALEQKKSVGWLKSRLGHSQEDWRRDYMRVAVTEMNNAYHEGLGASIAKRKGMEARVSKIPNPDACHKCKELYLDRSGRPLVFELGDLAGKSNAFNQDGSKKKSSEWVATLESAHPNCKCTLVELPDDFELDENFDMQPIEERE